MRIENIPAMLPCHYSMKMMQGNFSMVNNHKQLLTQYDSLFFQQDFFSKHRSLLNHLLCFLHQIILNDRAVHTAFHPRIERWNNCPKEFHNFYWILKRERQLRYYFAVVVPHYFYNSSNPADVVQAHKKLHRQVKKKIA